MNIKKGDPQWEALFRIWIQEKKPGWVMQGGATYKVFQPTDDEVFFQDASGGIDPSYSSLSTKGMS